MPARHVARLLLSTAFLARGLDSLQRPAGRAATARRVSEALSPARDSPPDALLGSALLDPELLVRANGAVMTGAGALLALGQLPRTAALTLAVTMLPGATVGHPFWTEQDPGRRERERQAFCTDVSLVGAALLVALTPDPRRHRRPGD